MPRCTVGIPDSKSCGHNSSFTRNGFLLPLPLFFQTNIQARYKWYFSTGPLLVTPFCNGSAFSDLCSPIFRTLRVLSSGCFVLLFDCVEVCPIIKCRGIPYVPLTNIIPGSQKVLIKDFTGPFRDPERARTLQPWKGISSALPNTSILRRFQ